MRSPYTGFWLRTLAYLIDTVVIFVPLVAVLLSLVPEGEGMPTGAEREDPERMEQWQGVRTFIKFGVAAVWIAYYALLESSSWQASLGKRCVGVKVVDQNGERLSLRTSFVRSLVKYFSSFVLIGLLRVLWNKKRQGWHDEAASTYVVPRHVTPEQFRSFDLDDEVRR